MMPLFVQPSAGTFNGPELESPCLLLVIVSELFQKAVVGWSPALQLKAQSILALLLSEAKFTMGI